MRRLWILFGWLCAAAAAPAAELGCADFLSQLRLKPAHVQFEQCRLEGQLQGKPLRATYRVAGVHAAAAESFLVRKARLKPLKRSCCQWDSPGGQVKGRDGRTYSIRMASAETPVASRRQWRKIAEFEIVVETLSEEI